jgi:hypothetical protein
MQNRWNNAKVAALFTIVLLMASSSLIALQVQAASENQEGGSTPGPLAAGVTADFTVKTHAFLSFRPNPVGLCRLFWSICGFSQQLMQADISKITK